MTDLPSAITFLEAVAGYTRGASRSSADRPIKLATVDPAYDPWLEYPSAPPPARVTFEGEDTLSGKAYGFVAGFVPWPGTRVFLLPVGNTYVIGGMINSQSPQGFWSNAAGTAAGVDFGGGSFYDTDEGLVVAGDTSIAGDLTIGGNGKPIGRGVLAVNWSASSSGAYGATMTTVAVLTDIVLQPKQAYCVSYGPRVQHSAASNMNAQLTRTTGSTGTLWEYGRIAINEPGVPFAAQGDAYIANASASPITLSLAVQMAASTGTGIHFGATNRRRYMMAVSVGRDTDFPQATAITS